MPVDNINTKPRVIKSMESIDEINEKAQAALKKRRLSDLRKHNYLYGSEKPSKEPYRRVVMTVSKLAVPRY